jgi:hypothetical protein
MDLPFLVLKEFSFAIIMKRVWNHAGLCELLMTLHVTAPEAAPVGAFGSITKASQFAVSRSN